ncbi:uncharacterized protein [Littorina saxatilis]|uniref:YTH domain-containing protein n=1 Tax=Littorina saxatilis TaxID=31220 RepID=A0AAN9B4F6_9CAEN
MLHSKHGKTQADDSSRGITLTRSGVCCLSSTQGKELLQVESLGSKDWYTTNARGIATVCKIKPMASTPAEGMNNKTMLTTTTAKSDTRYFVAKCGSMDSLRRCVTTKRWASRERVFPPQSHEILSDALPGGPVILIFSVNNCHGWHGYCCMTSTPAASLMDESLQNQESGSNEKLPLNSESTVVERKVDVGNVTQEQQCSLHNVEEENETGNVTQEQQCSLQNVEVENETGNVTQEQQCSLQNVEVENETGNVTQEQQCSLQNVEVENETGNVTQEQQCSLQNVEVENETGNVTQEQQCSLQNVEAENETGNVTQEQQCSLHNVEEENETGNVQCEPYTACIDLSPKAACSAKGHNILGDALNINSTKNTTEGIGKYDCITEVYSLSTDQALAQNQNTSNSEGKASDSWHYFTVEWQTEFISSFGESCLPSSKTADLNLPDGSPLNKARNWQEVSADTGAQVCSLLDEVCADLVEKRRRAEEAKLAAKPQPFIRMEGDVQEEAEQYWRCIVGKVERELGRVHLACPFGSQRYNVQQPDSDIDAFIVYQAHTKDLLGFDPPKMTIKNSDREKCDYTVLELKRYCELLLAYDARCIETLFLQDSTIIQASSQWRQLQKYRQQFLTRRCLDKYLSDALGSNGVQKLHRTVENSGLKGLQQPPARVAKLIYIIVRLLQNAVDIVRGRPLNVFRLDGSEERSILLKIRQADITLDEVNAIIHRLQEEIDGGKNSVIQEQPGAKKELESWLLSLRFQDFQAYPPARDS